MPISEEWYFSFQRGNITANQHKPTAVTSLWHMFITQSYKKTGKSIIIHKVSAYKLTKTMRFKISSISTWHYYSEQSLTTYDNMLYMRCECWCL